MKKPKVHMTDWELEFHDKEYNLSGYAEDHPQIGRNQYVSHTSEMVDHSFKDDMLTYETKNTVYVCPLKYMTLKPYRRMVEDYIINYLEIDKNSDSILDKLISASAKISVMDKKEEYKDTPAEMCLFPKRIMDITEDYSNDPFVCKIKQLQIIGQKELKEKKKTEEERLTGLARQYEDCIYIEVSNIDGGDPLAYHLGEDTGVLSPSVHVGMLQDSVLYMKLPKEDYSCSLDFRYFPKGLGDEIETYSWSDNIKKAVIRNTKSCCIIFNGVSIQPGETKEFTIETHREGLISPDCYNGKSVLFMPENESDEGITKDK